MKFYSEPLKRLFDTEKDLHEAEEKFTLEQKEKESKLAVKKDKAAKVEEAFKHVVEVQKEAEAKIKQAQEDYLKLRNEFVKEYGSFHMTYTDPDSKNYFSDTFELIKNLLLDF